MFSKMTKQSIWRVLSIGMMFCVFGFYTSDSVVAQTAAESLYSPILYYKNGTPRTQLFSASANGVHSLNIPDWNCIAVSENGHYIALSTQTARNLTIIDLNTGDRLLEAMWQSEWARCQFSWEDATTVHINTTGSISAGVAVSIETGQARQSRNLETSVVMIPHLAPDDITITSPNNRFVAYNRCETTLYTQDIEGYRRCAGSANMVVFDLQSQAIIQNLTDTQQGVFFDALRGFTEQIMVWSPNSRYLAYHTTTAPRQSPPPLQIFDAQAQRFLSTQVLNDANLDRERGFIWSPNGQYIAMWLYDFARWGDARRLAIYDTRVEQMIIAETLFNLAPTSWRWGLEETTITFVTDDRLALTQFNFINNSSTISDTGVADILDLGNE
jgi:hypothetical protein